MVSTEWSQLLYHKEEDKTASMIKHNAMKSLVATKAENAYQKPRQIYHSSNKIRYQHLLCY